jgi:acyl-CoA synthetase (AMP-forming)/AMP-acid ligase II/acyl carrier protein
MKLYDSLPAMLHDARGKNRSIRFIDGEKDEIVVTFDELWSRALHILGMLQSRGMKPHDELVIFTRSNESFVIAFWAALLGGIVPVPVAVGISDEHRLKLFRILQKMDRGTLFTEADLLDRLREFAKARNMPELIESQLQRTILSDYGEEGDDGDLHSVTADDDAFIQFSSGSTSEPKGVRLTHRNLATNIRAIIEGIGWNETESSLSWMPLTHDMGLIGYHLCALAAGMNHAIMDTSLFVRRPLLWISKASELRATQLCSPNFGYKHFLKLFNRKGLQNVDLGAVRLVLNGAEPISFELCEQFLDALAPFGLARSAMLPVYGLAEATVAVTFPDIGRDFERIVVHRHSLRVGTHYEPARDGDIDAVSFVKVGKAIRDCEIRLTDDHDRVVDSGIVGHIQIRGDNVTRGLYRNVEAEAEMFTTDAWLRTGDCGVLVDGDLVITGRSKDIIIVNGQNYYPHDLEGIIGEIEGLDLGKVVVCGVNDERQHGEQLLVFVLQRGELTDFHELAQTIVATVAARTTLQVDQVIPVSRIPKTTSGKVQRGQLAASYLDGEFKEAVAELSALSRQKAPADVGENHLIDELVGICREFSRDRPIGPDDNLFEVGVSSLTLTEIILAIDEKYPGKVDISDLFDYPTVRELATFLQRSPQAETA